MANTDFSGVALCLAESLIECGGFDPVDQLQRYRRWWNDGHLSSNGVCFDIGLTVRSALLKFERSREPYCGSTDPLSAGNGSIMRLAPVVLAYAEDSRAAIEKAAESSRTTHGAQEAIDACRYLSALIVGALSGESKDVLLSEQYEPVSRLCSESHLAPKIAEIAAGSFRNKGPSEIEGSGYVVKSLEAALWAFHRSANFREGALMAVNLGDDADTTGAVYGQLAGAYYGEGGIPLEWRALLAQRELIESFAEQLYVLSRKLSAEFAA